jgi:hypothetical protein
MHDLDFGGFVIDPARRQRRERWCVAFTERAKRTSLRRRRWFRISDIEPDPVGRRPLIGRWRASIYSGDLVLNGKSQVLCTSATPLLSDHRLPPECARGEHFNMIVDDLWMSAPRWLDWFMQVGLAPPPWMPRSTRELQKKKRQEKKVGRPSYDWSVAQRRVSELMHHHGDFDSTDPEWNAQARLEEEISKLLEYQHAAESTIRSKVGQLVTRWRAARSQGR